MNPDKNQGVTIVQQPFDMNLFLKHQVDSASAMTYNELAQVLETKNPKTGKLYTLADLNVIKMQNVGTGHARGRPLLDRQVAEGSRPTRRSRSSSSKASLEGWIYCRDHAGRLREHHAGSTGRPCPKGHQTWQMNEINKLIWPSASRDRRS